MHEKFEVLIFEKIHIILSYLSYLWSLTVTNDKNHCKYVRLIQNLTSLCTNLASFVSRGFKWRIMSVKTSTELGTKHPWEKETQLLDSIIYFSFFFHFLSEDLNLNLNSTMIWLLTLFHIKRISYSLDYKIYFSIRHSRHTLLSCDFKAEDYS